MKCPACEKGNLNLQQRNVPFTYLGITVTIPMQTFVCDTCEDGKFIPDEIKTKVDKFLNHVRKYIKKDLELK